MSEVPAVPPVKMAAWVAFMQSHAQIMKRMSTDLDDSGQISFSTYDILVQLSEAGGSLRLKDLLAKLLVVSQPGLSRRVERLEVQGLVERRPDPDDGRGVVVKLSRSGRSALRTAAKVHMTSILQEFGDRISDDEAAVLARVLDRIAEPPAR